MRRIASTTSWAALIVLGAVSVAAPTSAAEARASGKPAPKPAARDTTPPRIVCPADITAEATAATGAEVSFAASVTDDVDPAPTVTYSPASGSTFPLGTTTVTVTATDWKRNTSKGTFKVTVRDTTPPTIVRPADIFKNANDPGGAVVTFAASVTDRVDPAPSVTCSPASGSTFPDGTTTVTVTATDSRGNSATVTFDVTYDADPTQCPFAGTYTTSWMGWDDVTGDPRVSYEWTFTVAPDGSVTGEGVQMALAIYYVDDEGYPLAILGYEPAPGGLSPAIPASGHVTDAGSLQYEYLFQEWAYLYQYDVYALYGPYLLTATGQVSLDADGNLLFEDGQVWYRR